MDVKPIFAEEVLYGGCFGTDKLVKVFILFLILETVMFKTFVYLILIKTFFKLSATNSCAQWFLKL